MLMRLKGIKPVTVRYKGRVYRYYYHRATGSKINAEIGTAAFATEVERLDARAKELAPKDGSLRALIFAYRKSPEFTENISNRTRSDYDKVFDWLAPIGDMPAHAIDAAFVYGLRDKAFKQHKRRFANYVVQVVRLLLAWGKPRKHVAANHAVGVEAIPRPKGMMRANRPWADAERDTVLSEAPIHLGLMVALGMFVGLREGDACIALKAAYDGQLFEAVASKNGEPLWIPAHYRLREIIGKAHEARREAQVRRSKRRKVVPLDPPNLAITTRGTPWTESGFRASFFKLIRNLESAGKVRPGLTFHGLRHTLGKLIIEAGGTIAQVKALTGDRSDAMANLYSREHDKKRLATAIVAKLERNERRRLEKTTDASGKKKNGPL